MNNQQLIKLEIEKLEIGGKLTPDRVLEAAKDPQSILHGLFEWDNKLAAHQHRLEQARSLIRSVKVVVTTDKSIISTVAYVRDPDAQHGEQGYIATASILNDVERSREVLCAEFARASAALDRAHKLASVFGLEFKVAHAMATIANLKSDAQSASAH
jgi:hypothetical protein